MKTYRTVVEITYQGKPAACAKTHDAIGDAVDNLFESGLLGAGLTYAASTVERYEVLEIRSS